MLWVDCQGIKMVSLGLTKLYAVLGMIARYLLDGCWNFMSSVTKRLLGDK